MYIVHLWEGFECILAPKLALAQNPLFNKEHVSGLMFPKAQFGIHNLGRLIWQWCTGMAEMR